MTNIVWFRQDLRLGDNPALSEAAARGVVVPVFILDDTDKNRSWGGASLWWLHHSLTSLRKSLKHLSVYRGDPRKILPELVEEAEAEAVFWNRLYDPHAVKRDAEIKASFKRNGITAESFNAALLNEPWEIETGSGDPYKVFTPYWRAAKARDVTKPHRAPRKLNTRVLASSENIDEWGLLPKKPNWAHGWQKIWTPGEDGAQEQLDRFVSKALKGYGELRDRPDLTNTSRLSPHLHWGEISPRQIATRIAIAREEKGHHNDADKFMSEVGWREFCHHLLFHWPTLPTENWRDSFDNYPWRKSSAISKPWQKGQTGYPLVDAGMRELWHTGWMHNRVRMVAASFLVKHLRIDWREGESWFWDTLVDADLANNAAGWQWVAGSGADASPYFRIFNPVTQSERFDPNGEYIRRWCPELAKLPDELIHTPFKASEDELEKAGITLGKEYPKPIVDHAEAREAALKGYEKVRKGD